MGLVYRLRGSDVLWARAVPAGLAFAALLELGRGMRDLLTGEHKKPGF